MAKEIKMKVWHREVLIIEDYMVLGEDLWKVQYERQGHSFLNHCVNKSTHRKPFGQV